MSHEALEGQSSIYRAVHDVATGLIGARGPDLDSAITTSLARVGAYFGVESVGLGGVSMTGELVPSLYVFGPEPSREEALNLAPPGPQLAAQYRREGSVVWNGLEDLGELPQFQEHSRQMGVSAGVYWAHRDMGSHVEGMAIGSPTPRVWPVDVAEQLGIFGDVLYNALYRRRAEVEVETLMAELTTMRKLERVVTDLAAQFIGRPDDQIDGVIKTALGRLGETLGLGFAVVLRWNDPEQSTLTVLHEWAASSIDPAYAAGSVLSEPEGWLAKRLREAKPLLISHVEDLPPEADGERDRWARAGVRSVAWAPFMGVDGHRGVVGVGAEHPGPSLEELGPVLSLFGSVCVDASERLHAHLELREAYEQIQTLKDRLESENIALKEEIKTSSVGDDLVGKSHAFRTVLRQMEQVAGTDATVLLLGETGTGKGLVARRIHEMSGRHERPMVTVNCAALPATLIESELFGHEKGAFTGATSRKIGRFELADGGTIFLDEVGDLPLELQAKLLRVLQDRQFERLGSSTTLTVDTRVIAATNRDLDLLIAEQRFRSDLYYRLGVFPIRMPPLRERRADIALLVWFFVADLQARLGKRFDSIPSYVMERLVSHDWPGNVRELQNILERAMILAPGPELDFRGVLPIGGTENHALTEAPGQPGASLQEVERSHILAVLEECGWKVRGKGGAAERLDLNRSTLQSRMKKLGIQRPTA